MRLMILKIWKILEILKTRQFLRIQKILKIVKNTRMLIILWINSFKKKLENLFNFLTRQEDINEWFIKGCLRILL